MAPYVAPLGARWSSPTVPGGTCAPADRLRVLEVNGWWEQELSALRPTMPYDESDAQKNYFGVHLYSKLKLSDTSVQQLTRSNNPSIFSTATLALRRSVRVYAIHPRPLQIGQSTAERRLSPSTTSKRPSSLQ